MKREIIRVEPLATYLEKYKAPASTVTKHAAPFRIPADGPVEKSNTKGRATRPDASYGPGWSNHRDVPRINCPWRRSAQFENAPTSLKKRTTKRTPVTK